MGAFFCRKSRWKTRSAKSTKWLATFRALLQIYILNEDFGCQPSFHAIKLLSQKVSF
jgi:hypothetical protein